MADSEKDPAGRPPPPARTSELAERIRKAQDARSARNGGGADAGRGEMSAMGRGLRIGAEFAAAILVGSGLGYLIDMAAGTRPWALLIMFMVGFAAGIMNVTRVVAEMNAQKPASTDADRPD